MLVTYMFCKLYNNIQILTFVYCINIVNNNGNDVFVLVVNSIKELFLPSVRISPANAASLFTTVNVASMTPFLYSLTVV